MSLSRGVRGSGRTRRAGLAAVVLGSSISFLGCTQRQFEGGVHVPNRYDATPLASVGFRMMGAAAPDPVKGAMGNAIADTLDTYAGHNAQRESQDQTAITFQTPQFQAYSFPVQQEPERPSFLQRRRYLASRPSDSNGDGEFGIGELLEGESYDFRQGTRAVFCAWYPSGSPPLKISVIDSKGSIIDKQYVNPCSYGPQISMTTDRLAPGTYTIRWEELRVGESEATFYTKGEHSIRIWGADERMPFTLGQNYDSRPTHAK